MKIRTRNKSRTQILSLPMYDLWSSLAYILLFLTSCCDIRCYLGSFWADISLHKDFVAIGSFHFRLAVLIVYFLAHVLSRKQTLLISLVDEIF